MAVDNPDIVSKWSTAYLVFFLRLRGVEVPEPITRDELIALVHSKADCEIISVKVTPYVLNNLTHSQLVLYLEERGYAVMPKAKVMPMGSKDLCEQAQAALIEASLEDYQNNIKGNTSEESADFDRIIPTIVQKEGKRNFTLYEETGELSFDQFDTMYQPFHVQALLSKLGAQEAVSTLNLSEQLQFANQSMRFLATGRAQ